MSILSSNNDFVRFFDYQSEKKDLINQLDFYCKDNSLDDIKMNREDYLKIKRGSRTCF